MNQAIQFWTDRAKRAERTLIAVTHDLRRAEATNAALVEALEPFAAFANAFDAKPLGGMDDILYGIHAGTEWESVIRRSDCIKAREALALTPDTGG